MAGAVLVVGATGNIGVAVTIAARRAGLHVIAPVRNASSAAKLFDHVGTRDGITTVEIDVTSESGIQSIVDRVMAGELPAFQHVYSTVGVWNPMPLHNIDTASFRSVMATTVESSFFAYRATVPYLLKQADPSSTWTIMTGAAGELGTAGVTAVAQGALFTLANVGCRELAETNIRFNEVHLSFRVDYDSVAKQKGDGSVGSGKMAKHYENLLVRPDIKGARINLARPEDVNTLPFTKKLS
ncbi:uncharacterized protein CTRU02_209510 [Colletotrichum truncatum]|uniref:Uncharacterized protein n=1 Tax=Colletotrichum truncatum TaxID=5467 RepID=A0ACC3YSM6_COLTU|nr:uncharacterized protein CTRU02_15264 [Colletotrichum truncatum]KAF6781235.1 hypothetical protein CTRU02_15264 [Colletotrichum truncatum]